MSPSFGASAEEAGKLIDALGEWLAARAGGASAVADWLPHAGSLGQDCRLCPICQLIGALRQARPDVVEHLDDAVGSLLTAARLLVETGESARSARPPGFERIRVT